MASEIDLDNVLDNTNDALRAKPKVSPELAIELLKKLYGLEATEIKEMNSFVDRNFHVKVSQQHNNPYIDQILDSGYTLKIINTSKSSMEGHFDSMHTAVLHLDKKGLRVPVPVKNLNGTTWHLEKVPLMDEDSSEEKKCGVYLYTYIPGVPVSSIDNTYENLYQWGTLLAKFHKALEDLDCPPLKSKVILSSVKFIPLIANFMESLDEELRKKVRSVLERFQSEITENLCNLPEGFIHGDFNDHNIMAQPLAPGSNTYVADGMLDFEDIHYGPYAWDLGLMLGHTAVISKTLDPVDAIGHALAGYKSVRDLSDLEISVLKICLESRICQTLVFTNHCTKLDPDNAYISSLTQTEAKCAVLDLLSTVTREELLKRWNDIFASYSSN
ncbi:hypothetical protein JTE90_010942 [Oedothorax gibbosus]|uniref:Hydroxylysine kinase n=1 Tax=Oedothorax gibbosus TaxID=931172 RepID=A0AAV6UAB0_9ARAC|nr:hypothetical protein JTE90_010942 [Oedothorax gibbosus]